MVRKKHARSRNTNSSGGQGGRSNSSSSRSRSGGSSSTRGGSRRPTKRSYQPRRNNNRYQNQDDFSQQPQGEPEAVSGVLELHPNGYGFLRSPKKNYMRERTDAFVPAALIEKHGLREGVLIKGTAQQQRRQQGPRLIEIETIEGKTPDEYMEVKDFDTLTPINPEDWLQLETGPQPLSARVIDLMTPLGKGQRALIVAPPRTGKTVLLQQISSSISKNHPDLKLFVLLIDERPEEVTEMQRLVNGEVVASSLDRDVESHIRLAQLIVQRCRRLVEAGQDVFLLIDSITRLARAFNKTSNGGPVMTGGVGIRALDIPKKLFATARSFEEGGSLTIVATALIDTGSKMDELIFQEFKGTGNMELVLDRKLADRRTWPAIDISQSGTRREEKLLTPVTMHAVNMLRRTLSSMGHVEAMEQLTSTLQKFGSNRDFIEHIVSARSR
ncbi:Transcription termination factor Rho [Planctomycetales bacterium 10988]|nr:Transcription termination factor Rho [Planctomycetales bacterium 10988]